MRIIIHGESNTPGKKDFTGAFLPEAKAFEKSTGKSHTVTFDNSLPIAKRWTQLRSRLDRVVQEDSLTSVALFCHGWADGTQVGIHRRNVGAFVGVLSEFNPAPDIRIVLYCCSTGADPHDDQTQAPGMTAVTSMSAAVGEGSFADKLRDTLCEQGFTKNHVIAHTTAGHTTQNPHVAIFEGMGSPIGGFGGTRPFKPSDKLLWKTWVRLLKTDFRFEYPLLSIAEIHERVLKASK